MKSAMIQMDDTIPILVSIDSEQQSIGQNVPHYRVLIKRLKEVVSDVGALRETMIGVETSSILDLLGGCGFSGTMLRSLYPNAKLILNDMDPVCFRILKDNFADAEIHQKDVLDWEYPPADVVWIDFNNFTLKRLSTWSRVFERARTASRTLVFTDSACYGFKFGNLSCYGVKRPIQYYQMLNDRLNDLTGKHIRSVVVFGGAAVIRMENNPGELVMTKSFTPIRVSVVEKTGLFA